MKKIILYYDGDCPFCKEYSKFIQLKKIYDIQMCNARDSLDKMYEFKQLGLDINDGFIVESIDDGKLYHGADAAQVLDKLINKDTLFSHLISIVVNLPIFKSVIYPLVKKVRLVILKISNKKPNIDY